MIKRLLPALFLLIVISSACKKGANETNAAASIAGKWYWVEQTYDSYADNQLTDHEDYTTSLDPLSYFEFEADGTFIENPQDKNTQYLYGKYSIIANTLRIKRDVDTDTIIYTVKKLTTASLILHRTSGQTPYRGETEYTLKRKQCLIKTKYKTYIVYFLKFSVKS